MPQTQTWIDRLARRLATATTRRDLARLGAGGTLAGLALGADEAQAACKPPKKKCRKGAECCSRRCRKGKCAPCATGQTLCPGAGCVDLRSNPDHCGLCGLSCSPGYLCANGGCACPNCTTGCCGSDATCKPGTTVEFCGANGRSCVACVRGEGCVDGECVDLACGAGGPCRAFVTSSTQAGGFGGIGGGDAICRTLAAAANLPGANTYMAWLSDQTTSPATRFHRSTGPYKLLNGIIIANNWADLTDGTLADRLKRTEKNQAIAGAEVWTGTRADGAADGGGDEHNCRGWTEAGNGATAATGWSDSLDAGWTDIGGGVSNCTSAFRLYCFQQP